MISNVPPPVVALQTFQEFIQNSLELPLLLRKPSHTENIGSEHFSIEMKYFEEDSPQGISRRLIQFAEEYYKPHDLKLVDDDKEGINRLIPLNRNLEASFTLQIWPLESHGLIAVHIRKYQRSK